MTACRQICSILSRKIEKQDLGSNLGTFLKGVVRHLLTFPISNFESHCVIVVFSFRKTKIKKQHEMKCFKETHRNAVRLLSEAHRRLITDFSHISQDNKNISVVYFPLGLIT